MLNSQSSFKCAFQGNSIFEVEKYRNTKTLLIARDLNVMFLPIGTSDPWKNTSSFTKNSAFDSRFLNLQGLVRQTA